MSERLSLKIKRTTFPMPPKSKVVGKAVEYPSPGTILNNNWRLGNVLGAGSFGRVYAVTPTKPIPGHSCEFVIKVIPIGTTKQQISQANSLYHENILYNQLHTFPFRPIVPMRAYGDSNGFRYLVMERLEQDLKQFAQKSPSISEIFRIGRDLMSGLEQIHKKEWLFIDIKPDNFMLKGSKVHFIDFGLAEKWRSFNGKVREPTPPRSVVVGTLEYSSLAVQDGAVPERKDEVEALIYMLFDILLQSKHNTLSSSTTPSSSSSTPSSSSNNLSFSSSTPASSLLSLPWCPPYPINSERELKIRKREIVEDGRMERWMKESNCHELWSILSSVLLVPYGTAPPYSLYIQQLKEAEERTKGKGKESEGEELVVEDVEGEEENQVRLSKKQKIELSAEQQKIIFYSLSFQSSSSSPSSSSPSSSPSFKSNNNIPILHPSTSSIPSTSRMTRSTRSTTMSHTASTSAIGTTSTDPSPSSSSFSSSSSTYTSSEAKMASTSSSTALFSASSSLISSSSSTSSFPYFSSSSDHPFSHIHRIEDKDNDDEKEKEKEKEKLDNNNNNNNDDDFINDVDVDYVGEIHSHPPSLSPSFPPPPLHNPFLLPLQTKNHNKRERERRRGGGGEEEEEVRQKETNQKKKEKRVKEEKKGEEDSEIMQTEVERVKEKKSRKKREEMRKSLRLSGPFTLSSSLPSSSSTSFSSSSSSLSPSPPVTTTSTVFSSSTTTPLLSSSSSTSSSPSTFTPPTTTTTTISSSSSSSPSSTPPSLSRYCWFEVLTIRENDEKIEEEQEEEQEKEEEVGGGGGGGVGVLSSIDCHEFIEYLLSLSSSHQPLLQQEEEKEKEKQQKQQQISSSSSSSFTTSSSFITTRMTRSATAKKQSSSSSPSSLSSFSPPVSFCCEIMIGRQEKEEEKEDEEKEEKEEEVVVVVEVGGGGGGGIKNHLLMKKNKMMMTPRRGGREGRRREREVERKRTKIIDKNQSSSSSSSSSELIGRRDVNDPEVSQSHLLVRFTFTPHPSSSDSLSSSSEIPTGEWIVDVNDNGSTNGTRINGKRIRPHRWYRLTPEDELKLSHSSFLSLFFPLMSQNSN